MHPKQSAVESNEQNVGKGVSTSPAARAATIPYSGWKEKGDGRFYGASKRAVQGPVGSLSFAAVILERNQMNNGLFCRSPTRVAFFSDRQTALDTACRWFRQAQNIPVDEDIIKFNATLWARPPKTKTVSADEKLMENEAAITVGEVSSDIASHPNREMTTIPTEADQAEVPVKPQSWWRVFFDSLLVRLVLFISWMKSIGTLQTQAREGK